MACWYRRQFETDPDTICGIVAVTKYLHLESYTEHRAVAHFDQALKRLTSIMLKNDNSPLLRECSQALLVFVDCDVALKGKAVCLCRCGHIYAHLFALLTVFPPATRRRHVCRHFSTRSLATSISS